MSDPTPFPRRITAAEVRVADPRAFRFAASGVGVTALGAALLVLFALLQSETLTAPWIEAVGGLLVVAALWGGLLCGALGIALIAHPLGVRREIGLVRYARARGLSYARFGAPLDLTGVLFAGRAAAAPPVYRSEYELSSSDPRGVQLRTGIAVFSGGKNDRGGPRSTFRFLTVRLPRRVPHLMIDSLRNGRLRHVFPGIQRLRLEGDVDRHFAVYAPQGYERDALQLLTPDVLVCLLDHGRSWDIEVVDDRVVVASGRFQPWRDAAEVPALLRFADLLSEEIGTQALYYTDPRAELPRRQVSAGGRRLRRRTGAWAVALVIGVGAAVLAFPFALMWVLDAF